MRLLDDAAASLHQVAAQDLLVGVHAHATKYYTALGMLRSSMNDPAPELPNMRKVCQASALVALGALTCSLTR